MRKSNKKDGEPLTLEGLFKDLYGLFKGDEFVARKDDPKFGDIKSMLKSLVDGEACFDEKAEDDAMTACPDGLDPVVEEKNSPYDENYFEVHHTVKDAVNTTITVGMEDAHGKVIRAICFLSSPQMIEGIAETLGGMKKPMIGAFEDGVLTKAAILCGINRVKAHQRHGKLAAFAFDEQKGGMCRLSINRKDGYDFIFGENGVTRFIIFDEEVCPDTIPADILQDDRKWGKRMTSELPKMIEKRIEESKEKSPLCNLPETCAFEDCPHDVKKPIIADIMKDFTEAKGKGKVGKDTFVEFMKPENKEAVASAVATSIAERQNPSEDVIEKDEVTKAVESAIFEDVEDDFSEEDTNPDCFRCIAEYMAKEGVDTINFYTDCEGLIHCDVRMKTVYKVELDDSEKK